MDDSVNPLVSIVMPAFNAEATIEQAIDSVLTQTLGSWELLVVDDGSTDNTASLVELYLDDRIRLIKQENQGVSAARNAALDLASGEFLSFLDADDVLPPNSLKVRSDALIATPGADFVDGVVTVKDFELRKTMRVYQHESTMCLAEALVKLDDRRFMGCSYMIRRKLAGVSRFGKKASHCEDLMFFLEVAAKQRSSSIAVNEQVYIYRTGYQSAMANLQGLTEGYKQFFNQAKTYRMIGRTSYLMGKTKAAKVMLLCFLRKGKPFKAVQSAFSIIFV